MKLGHERLKVYIKRSGCKNIKDSVYAYVTIAISSKTSSYYIQIQLNVTLKYLLSVIFFLK